MKAKKYLSILIAVTLTTSAVAFTGGIGPAYPPISQILFSAGITAQGHFPSETPSQDATKAVNGSDGETVKNVPDKVVYFILFNHLVGLKKQAEKMAAKGENLNYFKLYEKQANLNGSESQVLFQTAQDCMNAINSINDEARKIIIEARGNGELKSLDSMPAPPKELEELQQRKDETILQYRDKLRNSMGTERFARLNEFAQQKIAPQVRPIDGEVK